MGVSNYSMMLLHDSVIQPKIQPACNQIEVHAYYQSESLVNYCFSRNICVTAHTPEIWDMHIPSKDPIISEIANVHGKSPAQVLLRSLQRGIFVLTKSVKPERMLENKDILIFID